ncbi:MAG: hypothetical protein WC523_02260 [Patescibacteria group bacterium]|jgi:hypothetical protein
MKLSSKINQIIANLNDYLLLIITLTVIFGAGVYYLYALNRPGVIIALVLIIASFYFLVKLIFKNQITEKNYLILNKKSLFFGLAYLLLFGLSLYTLWASASSRALISPWQVVDNRFFLFYALTSLILILTLIKKEISPTAKLILLSLHYFLSLGVAVIVYKIGYGFDPFIHQATMELIDKKGLVTPKPPYYLGEYGLVIIFHKITGLSIYLLNKILVPLLTAIFLPLTFYRFLKPGEENSDQQSKAAKFLTILFLLALTFSPFIVTTPQNLTYLFLILTIFAGLGRANPLEVLLLALAVLAIHPLTGIPVTLWSLFLIIQKYRARFKPLTQKILKMTIFCLNSLALPLILYLTAGRDFKKIVLSLNFLSEPFKNLFSTLSAAGQENWLLNFVYFIAYNYNLFLIIALAASLIYFYRQKNRPNWQSLILINLSLLIAYVLASQISFTDLINYEQANYASRILVIIIIFFLPYLVLSLDHLIRKILMSELPIRLLWLGFGLALLTITLYISYPRYDKYFNSRGYSVSANDLLAVKTIAASSTVPYLALANQQVSVAALQELGFDHYYQTSAGLIYFYPIPTGGELYQYYLKMVYEKPRRETMLQALNLAGVNEGYLIINKYWFNSSQIINEAKLTADDWSTVNKEIYIFRYQR